MALTVEEISRRLGGRLEGEGTAAITALAAIKEAKSGDITFLANPRYAHEVPGTRASAVIVAEDWQGACPAALIRVKDPNLAFTEVASWLAPRLTPAFSGIHPTAVIAPDARLGIDVAVGPAAVIEPGAVIGERTLIGAGCYIGHGTVIGTDCRFYPHVSTREYTRIGDRCIFHNGAVIGSDGFGYNREGAKWKKIPQLGVVVIGDDVELGANMTVDRARFGETRIGNGTKIDNLVQVAHNVTIGEDVAIASQAGISGSTSIGSRVQIGGQAGFTGHLEIGDDSVVGAQSGVSKNVPPKTFVLGAPAMRYDKMMKTNAHVMRLPELKQRVAALEARIKQLESQRVSGDPA